MDSVLSDAACPAYQPARPAPRRCGRLRLALLVPMPLFVLLLTGCSAFPEIRHQPELHNPFPQLYRVAVLPFYNQSSEPTLNGERVALAYYNQLQDIRGFEVMPVGVARTYLQVSGVEPHSAEDFQALARQLGVDAVVVGAITEYSSYYPPRMGLAVNWYAANPCFHPIPPGYGLPWGTAEEEYIPESLVFETEFALAREQLKTQTPGVPPPVGRPGAAADAAENQETAGAAEVQALCTERLPDELAGSPAPLASLSAEPAPLPADWPDPSGLIPAAPQPQRPLCLPQHEPVITHTALYSGHDSEFTERLADYYFFRDDARFGGWQSYLQRSEDFINFCCYLHLSETLTARGGAGKSRVVWRWPFGRYQR